MLFYLFFLLDENKRIYFFAIYFDFLRESKKILRFAFLKKKKNKDEKKKIRKRGEIIKHFIKKI